jgi:N-acetyl-anhydromuramyl-L-alanine amidase AmpD
MARPDYGQATWYGAYSGNYMTASRPSHYTYGGKQYPAPINKVIIHVAQGSWSSALNWFNDSRAGVSAHYTVRSSDGKIGQSVQEKDIAYHAGWWDYNRTSVGIEHEGYVSNASWFTDAMYRSSARLTAYLCKKYKIPIDRQHIIGHHEVPGCSGSGGGAGCHTDPGGYWDWNRYINLVKGYAGTVSNSTTYQQVVDNASPRFRASSDWKVSTWNSQKFRDDYRYTTPRKVRDTAKFKVKIPKKGRYAVFARWPADTGYNNKTHFLVRTSSG